MPKASAVYLAPYTFHFEYQALATMNQANPVQNTWYTLLEVEECCRVYHMGITIEDDDETVEWRATIDGVVLTAFGAAIAHSQNQFCYIVAESDTQEMACRITGTRADITPASFLCEGHSIKIEVRKTTANGAGNLEAVLDYALKTLCI